jgi:hypothetical protein
MPRTPEQIEADSALSLAVDAVVKAYEMSAAGEVNGDYVLVVEQQCMDEEGDINHSYCIMLKDGRVSTVRAVGLLETATFDLKMATRTQ